MNADDENGFDQRLEEMDSKFLSLTRLMAQCAEDEPVETKSSSSMFGTVETSFGVMRIVPFEQE